jgi:hypothetical protein
MRSTEKVTTGCAQGNEKGAYTFHYRNQLNTQEIINEGKEGQRAASCVENK